MSATLRLMFERCPVPLHYESVNFFYEVVDFVKKNITKDNVSDRKEFPNLIYIQKTANILRNPKLKDEGSEWKKLYLK